MRILHLIKNFDFGGAENHVRELANSFDNLGHDVFIVSGGGRQAEFLSKRVRFIALHLRDVFMPLHVLIVCYIILRNKIQVIHAHQRLPILVASLAGRITGVPVVVTVHGRTRYDLKSWITRKYSSRIIFVSRHVLEISAKYEQIKHKSLLIPNWVKVSERSAGRDINSICYISRIDRKHASIIKQIMRNVILPLSSKYPDISIRIVGEGDYLDEIRKEAYEINSLVNNVLFDIRGFIPDVKEIINQSGLVLGVGRVALEALACGVPVVSINQKRMGTFISTKNYAWYRDNNFVAVGSHGPDYELLTGILSEYLSDPELWGRETLALQSMVSQDFNQHKISDSLRSLYSEVIVP